MFLKYINSHGNEFFINTETIETITKKDNGDGWSVNLISGDSYHFSQEEYERLQEALLSEPAQSKKTRYEILRESRPGER